MNVEIHCANRQAMKHTSNICMIISMISPTEFFAQLPYTLETRVPTLGKIYLRTGIPET